MQFNEYYWNLNNPISFPPSNIALVTVGELPPMPTIALRVTDDDNQRITDNNDDRIID